jgi:flagellar basal body-associated protein FliL
MPNYVPASSSGGLGSDFAIVILAVVAVLIAIVIFFYIIYRASKSSYQKPQVSMETLGVKRGLTAVEASYLLDMKPPQLVTEILYSLLQKRAV